MHKRPKKVIFEIKFELQERVSLMLSEGQAFWERVAREKAPGRNEHGLQETQNESSTGVHSVIQQATHAHLIVADRSGHGIMMYLKAADGPTCCIRDFSHHLLLSFRTQGIRWLGEHLCS